MSNDTYELDGVSYQAEKKFIGIWNGVESPETLRMNVKGDIFTYADYKALKNFYSSVRNIFTNIQPLMNESQILHEISSALISCHLALEFGEETEQSKND